ncbi:MAG: hypothetical protein NTW26_02705 [bacterium]|nr:hypothetical protein [bacterium]
MKLTPRMEIFVVYGGLVAAAALLVRRSSLLLQAGWSAEASVGGLLYTLLDFLAAGVLLLVFLPLRRARTTGLKTVVYALAAVGVKTSWSLLDWGKFSTWFTLTDLGVCLTGVVCLLGALAILRRSGEDGD